MVDRTSGSLPAVTNTPKQQSLATLSSVVPDLPGISVYKEHHTCGSVCNVNDVLMLLLFWQTRIDHGRRLRSISSNYLSVPNPATLPAFLPKECT